MSKKLIKCAALLGLVLMLGSAPAAMAQGLKFGKADALKFRNYIDQAARKIINNASEEDGGLYWLTRNEYTNLPENSFGFHNGTPGVCYFLLKAYAVTGRKEYLEAARQGMIYVLRQERTDDLGYYIYDKMDGLFDGNAGRAHLFLYAYRVTGDRKYKDTADKLAKRILAASYKGADQAANMFAGASGVGMFLLKYYEITGDAAYLKGAEHLGDFVIEKAVPQGNGVKWNAGGTGNRARYFTGFAGGVAGNGYFLERLSRVSGNKAYGEYAGKVLAYFQETAVAEKGYLKWRREEIKAAEKFPSQWCHGAPGIGNFFVALYNGTKDPKYADLADKNIGYLLDQGFNVRKNGGICHGISGNAASVYAAYLTTGNKTYFNEMKNAVADLDRTVLKEADGYYWDAEMGKNDYCYQTGLAGIGDFFIFLYSNGRTRMFGGLGFGDDL